METTPISSPRSSVKRMLVLTLLVAGLSYLVYSLLIYPAYMQLSSDVAYRDTLLADILYLLTEDGLVSLCVFGVCYPATVYAIWRAGFGKAYGVPVAFASATLLKYVVNFFMTALSDKALPSWETFWAEDFPLIAGTYLAELVQYALVVVAVVIIRHVYLQKTAVPTVPTADGGEAPDALAGLMPFRKLMDFRNPAQLSAFVTACVVLLLRWLAHTSYQITLWYALLLGAGTPDVWFLVLLYFVTDVLVAALIYLVSLLLLSAFDRRDRKKAA